MPDEPTHWDAIVVGTGPAGMAAAAQLAEHGTNVLAIDEQPEPGGQIYRGVERTTRNGTLAALLGADYLHGLGLVRSFRASAAVYWPQTGFWHAARNAETGFYTVYVSRGGASLALTTKALILATGAMERPVPLPGWTLPGVMTVGAVQILLKSSAIRPTAPIVLAGSGPLFYLLAQQCLAVGTPITALLDTSQTRNLIRALPALPRALTGKGAGYFFKGLRMKSALRRAGVPIHRGVTDIAITGTDRVEAIHFSAAGKNHTLPATLVALHEGVIPGQNVTRLLECAHSWDLRQTAFQPVTDPWGASSLPGLMVAGDAGGIVGARAAEHQGRVAALETLHRLGRINTEERDRLADHDQTLLHAHVTIRPFLDRLYPPPMAISVPQGCVVVCRCEDVLASEIHDEARKGKGPNQIKTTLRCGMGPCQGRLCGPTVSQIVMSIRGSLPQPEDYYSIRPPLKPVAVGELARLANPG